MNTHRPALSEVEIEAALSSLRFAPPPLASLWTPRRTRRRSSHVRPLLLAAAVAVMGAGVVLAQEGLLPIFRTPLVEDCKPDSCGPNYAVAASATNDDDSVIAVNLIVASGTDRDALWDIAEEFWSRHAGSRVIVSFFAEGAGQEASGFGLVPSGFDDAFELPDQYASWLGTVEFKPDQPDSEWWSTD